jgi:Putative beta barrel porin-7 (BBP7)
VNLFDAAPNAILAKSSTKLLTPVESGPRWWIQADGGIYGFSKNSPIIAATAPPGSTGPIHLATAPGFVGLFTTSTVINPLAVGVPATFGAGGSYRMGYWLDPARTMAIDGSAFFVQGYSKFDLTSVPTTVRTSTSINTTPDVFVGLFTDTTTTALNGAISDQFFGADVNFRMKVAHFADLTNFDVLVGMRYAALNEKLAASVDSEFSRTYQPGLGLPPPVNFNNSSVGGGVFETRNNFIGPQIGFNAEQHWGRFWLGTENKLAVGAMIEGVSVSGSTENTITPTRTLVLAGIPLQVNGGAPVTGIVGGPPSFGLFTQGNRSKTAFALVPNGTITVGYDIIPDMLSLVLAYN